MTFFYVAALVALLIFWFFLRKREDKASSSPKSTVSRPDRRVSQGGSEFHAISIRPGRRACEAQKALDGQRILASEAPRLPLPGCDIVDCECSYVHYNDRRAGRDRRSPFGSGGISAISGKYEQERREGRERRHEDDDYFN